MSELELTDPERLILANQYDILSKLHDDPGYAKVSKELKAGHEWLYSQHIKSLLSPKLPQSEAEYVLCILGIFCDLEKSYNKLEDKSGIEEYLIRFSGFDANNESEFLSFAQALREDVRFTSILDKATINSYVSTTEMYKRIIECWRRLGEPSYPYNKETILSIVDSRKHPDAKKMNG